VTQNTASRLNRAQDTVTFLEQQIADVKPQLEKVDDQIRHYRITHKGSLPEELDTNLREMEQSRMLLGRISEMVSAASSRRRSMIQESVIGAHRDPSDDLSRALIDARSRYTGKHPELVRLEQEHKQAMARRKAEDRKALAAATTSPMAMESSREIAQMRATIGGLSKQIGTYEKRVAETMKHSDELTGLVRAHSGLKDKFTGLSTRLFEAELALGLEKQFKGSRFTLVDRAVPPSMASKPNKPELYAIAMVVSLLFSLGIAVLRESMDRSVHDPKSVRAAFGDLPVLACVPRIGRVSRNGHASPTLVASSHWGQSGVASLARPSPHKA